MDHHTFHWWEGVLRKGFDTEGFLSGNIINHQEL